MIVPSKTYLTFILASFPSLTTSRSCGANAKLDRKFVQALVFAVLRYCEVSAKSGQKARNVGQTHSIRARMRPMRVSTPADGYLDLLRRFYTTFTPWRAIHGTCPGVPQLSIAFVPDAKSGYIPTVRWFVPIALLQADRQRSPLT